MSSFIIDIYANTLIGRKKSLQVETDSTKCALGRFLSSPQAKGYAETFLAFSNFITEIAGPHKTLHRTAISIKDALEKGDFTKAGKIYSEKTLPALDQCDEFINKVIAAETAITDLQQKVFNIFNEKTKP
ncbi:MAG: CZB domain-containing protein, partial [Desulfobacterales bacterium]|nr:CZB domain-containing protein [Desulfobacterales bacterium]